ncbi:TetR/AcrR family transcriptional regulator [Xenorhabdus stockiae]|uniref:TetR/AcrR family transcriptional regulator n=1 Tax=Xenorhabdus stockiae TaxID=351614 RepID=UPI003CE816B8
MYEELSPKGKAKYNQILDAVQVVICRDGIYECNHRAVAAEAGVPLGTTTYYFKTLDDMLSAALGKYFNNFIELSHNWFQQSLFEDPAENLTEFISWTFADYSRLKSEYELYVAAISRPSLRPLAVNWMQATKDIISQYITNDESKAKALTAVLDAFFLQSLLTGDINFSKKEYIRPFISKILSD